MNFPLVDYIVNYDLKDDEYTYIHRIGRAGRAGNVGNAISFIDRENDGPRIDYYINVIFYANILS